jgi:hypothetical protein
VQASRGQALAGTAGALPQPHLAAAGPAGLLDLARAWQPNAVGVQEQQHHHSRLVGLLAPRILLPVDGVDLLKIQLAGQIQQKEHQVVLWCPLPRRPGSFLLPTAVPLLLPVPSPYGAALVTPSEKPSARAV